MAPAPTNIVVATLSTPRAADVVARLAARGVLATAMDASTLRFVTHHDVGGEECARAAAVAGELLG